MSYVGRRGPKVVCKYFTNSVVESDLKYYIIFLQTFWVSQLRIADKFYILTKFWRFFLILAALGRWVCKYFANSVVERFKLSYNHSPNILIFLNWLWLPCWNGFPFIASFSDNMSGFNQYGNYMKQRTNTRWNIYNKYFNFQVFIMMIACTKMRKSRKRFVVYPNTYTTREIIAWSAHCTCQWPRPSCQRISGLNTKRITDISSHTWRKSKKNAKRKSNGTQNKSFVIRKMKLFFQFAFND